MKFFGIYLISFIFVAVSLAAVPKDLQDGVSKKFSLIEKFALIAVSKLRPEIFRGASRNELLSKYDNPDIDFVFGELRTLLTQAKKLPSSSPEFPNLNWTYHYDSCSWFICLDFHTTLTTDGYSFEGLEDITSETEFTPSGIRNTFSVPSFQLNTPSFLFNITAYSGKQFLYRGFDFKADNLVTTTVMEYGYTPDVGIQVKNLTIHFNIVDLNVRSRIESYTVLNPDGTVEEYYENFDTPYTEYMIDMWERHQLEYEAGLQFRINCILSQKRSSPNCDDSEWRETYYKMNVIELIQAIGLGALSRS